ncbi:MAG: DUF1343 domain-containing protein [Kiritimatiellae bacterium]|nr:DUF1343 domain-containing protein [Kiritimatiellia bacterium]
MIARRARKLPRFQTGLEGWLSSGARGWNGAQFGVVAHAASVHRDGAHAVELLRERFGRGLAALFAPEHGFRGLAAAGERVEHARHSRWGIPIYSLYGEHRRPTPDMLRGLDALIFDVQDLGVRCYTYGSTLRLVLEAAAEAHLPVLVADRPIPFHRAADGPILEPGLESFVGMIPGAPLVHGLTPAELARWLCRNLAISVDLHLLPLRGSARGPAPEPWIPPSPSIRSWAAARWYPATVFTEALPALDCDRAGPFPFQSLGAAWMDPVRVKAELGRRTGARADPDRWTRSDGVRVAGLRLEERSAAGAAWRPVETGFRLLRAVGAAHGLDRVWRARGARPAFFDQLAGAGYARRALRGSDAAFRAALERMRRECAAFLRRAEAVRLYE